MLTTPLWRVNQEDFYLLLVCKTGITSQTLTNLNISPFFCLFLELTLFFQSRLKSSLLR